MVDAQEKKAQMLLAQAFESEHSSFYRDKYGVVGGQVVDGHLPWTALPYLTRQEIQQTSFQKRLFVPQSSIDILRVTSGTSGAGLIVVPRMGHERDTRSALYDSYMQTLNPTRLATFSGAQPVYAALFRHNFGFDSIQLDLADMRISSALASAYRPDMLAGFVYALTTLAPQLSQDVTDEVRVIQLFGEWCSSLQWQMLSTQFPNAMRVSEYASVETQSNVAVPCKHIIEQGERAMHPIPEWAHVEIVDPDTGEIQTEPGERGELVVTILRPVAFPLIRYKTGDVARIVRRECPCGAKTPVISVEGRLHIDRLRVSGGEINLAEADRAIAILPGITGGDFELRYEEAEGANGQILPRVTAALEWDEAQISGEELAMGLAEEMRVSPRRTYADGVRDGLYAPLSVVPLDSAPLSGKRKRIVRDAQ